MTFTSLTHGGYLYLLGGQGAADLNVNGPYTLGPVIEAIALSGFGASFDANVPGNVSSFGKFDLSLNNSDGFHDSGHLARLYTERYRCTVVECCGRAHSG